MENIAKIQSKIQEVLKKMQDRPEVYNARPGNIESLIKSSQHVEDGENTEAADEIGSIIKQLQDFAMQLAAEHKHEPVRNRYETKPKKYEGPNRGED